MWGRSGTKVAGSSSSLPPKEEEEGSTNICIRQTDSNTHLFIFFRMAIMAPSFRLGKSNGSLTTHKKTAWKKEDIFF